MMHDSAMQDSVHDSTMQNSVMRDSEMQDSEMQDSEMQDSEMQDSEMQDSVMHASTMQDSVMQGSMMQDSEMHDSTMHASTMQDSVMHDFMMQDSEMHASTMQNSEMHAPTMHAVPQSAAALIAQEQMLPDRVRVCVALSGGADSTALLLALRELEIPVSAFHLNHGLRGAEADRDEAFVRDLCARLHVPLAVRRADVPAFAAEHRLGTEEAARTLRYRLLEDCARALGCPCQATAHTADDNLETILFHLARGTGGKGLSGIPPVRGTILRPLLGCTRSQIESYLAACGQDYVTDSTNLGGDCTRNVIRHEVVPVLRRINPEVAAAAARLSGLLRTDEAFLEAAVQQALARARDGDGWRISAFPPLLRGRMLHRLLAECGAPMGSVGFHHVQLLEELLASANPSAVLALPGGLSARKEYGRFFLGPAPPPSAPPAETPITLPFCAEFRPGVRVRAEICKKSPDVHKKFNTFSVDCGTIDFDSLVVRTRLPGDRLRLHPNSGSKTLKRLMIDRRIPRDARDRLAVFADCRGVVAAEGLGPDSSRLGDGETMLRLSIEE